MSLVESVTIANEKSEIRQQRRSIQHALRIANAYHARSTIRTLIAVTTNYVVCLACMTVSQRAAVSSRVSPLVAGTLYCLASLLIASRMRALENLVHEASHNNLFPLTQLHHRLQLLYAFPVFRVVEDYRRSHLLHHKHLGDRHKDPDIVRLYGLGLEKLSVQPVWYLIGMPMTGFLTYEYLTTVFWEFWESSSSRTSKTLFWITVASGVIYSKAYRSFVYYYLIPFLVILPVTRYWAEISEHLGLDLRQDLGSSRTNIGILHRWYINPHNDGYHAVHHLCSQVPYYLLPQAHRILMRESGDYARATIISYGIMETFKQMIDGKTVARSGESAAGTIQLKEVE